MKVSFLLISYNQEKYIESALRSVLEQDYENLEIIVSDDSSTDSTWTIIQEIVAFYPSRNIILNRNQSNLGIGENICKAVKLSSGEIIILGAGDDNSVTNRVSKHVERYLHDPSVFACYSSYSEISDNGEFIRTKSFNEHEDHRLIRFVWNGGGLGIGATYSYRRQCFFWPWQYPVSLVNEDRLLPFRASILGTVKVIPDALVEYRLSFSGISRVTSPYKLLARFKPAHIIELQKTLSMIGAGVAPKPDAISLSLITLSLNILLNIGRALEFYKDSNSRAAAIYRTAMFLVYRFFRKIFLTITKL